jgi:hypothetical protein
MVSGDKIVLVSYTMGVVARAVPRQMKVITASASIFSINKKQFFQQQQTFIYAKH